RRAFMLGTFSLRGWHKRQPTHVAVERSGSATHLLLVRPAVERLRLLSVERRRGVLLAFRSRFARHAPQSWTGSGRNEQPRLPGLSNLADESGRHRHSDGNSENDWRPAWRAHWDPFAPQQGRIRHCE